MSTDHSFRIAVLPGDGIGVEVMDACLAVLERLERRVGGYRLACERHAGGAQLYRETGVAFPDASMTAAVPRSSPVMG